MNVNEQKLAILDFTEENFEQKQSPISQENVTPRTQSNNITSLPISPELIFPFQNIKILFPTEKEKALLGYMTYRIRVLWAGEEHEVERRFSNIDYLRSVLKAQLPYSVIFPVHYKNYIDQKNDTFLADRTEEITYFFRYIIFHSEKFFSCEKILKEFFNPDLSEITVNARLKEFEPLDFKDQLKLYKQITKKSEFTISKIEKRKEIEKFNESLQITILFFEVFLKETKGNDVHNLRKGNGKTDFGNEKKINGNVCPDFSRPKNI